MLLLIDVGNSNICLGVATKEDIVASFRIKTILNKTSDEYHVSISNLIQNYKIENVIISSVVPIVTSALVKCFKEYYNINPTILGPGLKTGIKIKADDPKSVGADILCDVKGAQIYSDKAIIVDLGTANKYIYYKDNTFMGIAISPGVSISMKALVSSAALLPDIELQVPEKIINNNTISCMQSGIIYSAVSEVDGMIDRIKEEVNDPNLKVIATGGLSGLIIPLCKNKIEVDSNLCLRGLLQIYLKNE